MFPTYHELLSQRLLTIINNHSECRVLLFLMAPEANHGCREGFLMIESQAGKAQSCFALF